MREIITKNFLPIVIVILLAIIILQKCNDTGSGQRGPDTTISYTYKKVDTTIITKPTEVKYVPYEVTSVQYMPASQDYATLLKQFDTLKKELLATRMYRDSFKVDTIGMAYISDTVQQNKITGRSINTKLLIPTKTVTITKYAPPKNKWFIGGGVAGNKGALVHDVNIGLGLLNKKDQLFEIKARPDFKGNIYYEVNTYWKIHF